MTYRNDHDAALARAADLKRRLEASERARLAAEQALAVSERRLIEAQEELGKLRGEDPADPSPGWQAREARRQRIAELIAIAVVSVAVIFAAFAIFG